MFGFEANGQVLGLDKAKMAGNASMNFLLTAQRYQLTACAMPLRAVWQPGWK
jgi:hypothetical protein